MATAGITTMAGPTRPPVRRSSSRARGTTIKELIYGSLSAEGLSPQPWEPREPGWGTHLIDYRAIDAAGNIGPARIFRVTLMPAPACSKSVTGERGGDLRVESGVTCVTDATINGGVFVGQGASLVATNARITGGVTASGAAIVELVGARVAGDVRITSGSDRVVVFGFDDRGRAGAHRQPAVEAGLRDRQRHRRSAHVLRQHHRAGQRGDAEPAPPPRRRAVRGAEARARRPSGLPLRAPA